MPVQQPSNHPRIELPKKSVNRRRKWRAKDGRTSQLKAVQLLTLQRAMIQGWGIAARLEKPQKLLESIDIGQALCLAKASLDAA